MDIRTSEGRRWARFMSLQTPVFSLSGRPRRNLNFDAQGMVAAGAEWSADSKPARRRHDHADGRQRPGHGPHRHQRHPLGRTCCALSRCGTRFSFRRRPRWMNLRQRCPARCRMSPGRALRQRGCTASWVRRRYRRLASRNTIKLNYTDTADWESPQPHDCTCRRSCRRCRCQLRRQRTPTMRSLASIGPVGCHRRDHPAQRAFRRPHPVFQSIRIGAADSRRRCGQHRSDINARVGDRDGDVAAVGLARNALLSWTAAAVYSGAISGSGSQKVGFAGRIAINPRAHRATLRGWLSIRRARRAAKYTRPKFHLQTAVPETSLTFSADTGLGTSDAPFSSSLPTYLRQVMSQQGDAAQSASNLQGTDRISS